MTLRILSILAAATLAAACTSTDQAPAKAAEGEQPASRAASRSVTVKGSDTMVILGQRVAERFMAAHPGKTVQVTGGGSGTGIASLINGTTDIAQSSRPMKASEKQQVEQKRGAAVVETPIALDGLAIFVHESNPLPAITLQQLKQIYTGELTNWKQLGGADSRIVLYGRENNSGTYAYFKEKVLEEEDFVAETQTLPGTAAVVNAVGKDRNSIGYGGIAYGSGIKHVPVKKDDASPAVEPEMENVTSGLYPISRYLFVYTAGAPTGDAKLFLDYALSEEGQKVAAEVGYYPLPKKPGAGETVAAEEAE